MARKQKAADSPKPDLLWLVQRLGWRVGQDNGRGICFRGEDDTGSPVTAFTDRAAAEQRRAELERQARLELNPFTFEHGEIELLCSDEEELLAGVKRLGLTPPRKRKRAHQSTRDWLRWWDEGFAGFTEEQKLGIWTLLDRLRLYAVVTTQFEE